MTSKTTVVDYGIGNLFSVSRALEHFGADVELASDPSTVLAADRLVLIGVGAFRSCIDELAKLNLIEALRTYANSARPLLGICVGMQMLFDRSFEFGVTPGIGLIQGEVRKIPDAGANGMKHKVPHVGWSNLEAPGSVQWGGTLLDGLTPGDAAVYFVHSYTAYPVDESCRLADADYHGCRISGVVRQGSAYGCQFHPEKSGEMGLHVLRNFVREPG